MSELIAGRYQLGELIGHGGMGTVHKGTDTRTQSPVAIKVLQPDVVAREPGIVERFRREGEALRRLNHPNIVKVLTMASGQGGYYLVMEYVPGGTLAELLLRHKTLPLPRVLGIALELSDALARAHHLGIIHRDLKPGNVMLAGDGSVRLTDFGIAFLSDRSRLTGAQTVVGTLAYLSPEALDGRPLDTRADIWSFGILLYEMLTGKPPFNEDTPSATVMSIFAKPVQPLSDLRADLPPALVELVRRMLDKDPAGRIASARLVGAELQAIIEGQESLLKPSPDAASAPAADSTVAFHALLDALLELADRWEEQVKEAEKRGEKVDMGNVQGAYNYRTAAQVYRASVGDLRAVLRDALGENTPSLPSTPTYVTVTRKDVTRLLERAGLKVKNLYEDKGSIFTAVFSKMPPVSMDERLRKLKDTAPGVDILETGKLQDTGDPFVDFAFLSWEQP